MCAGFTFLNHAVRRNLRILFLTITLTLTLTLAIINKFSGLSSQEEHVPDPSTTSLVGGCSIDLVATVLRDGPSLRAVPSPSRRWLIHRWSPRSATSWSTPVHRSCAARDRKARIAVTVYIALQSRFASLYTAMIRLDDGQVVLYRCARYRPTGAPFITCDDRYVVSCPSSKDREPEVIARARKCNGSQCKGKLDKHSLRRLVPYNWAVYIPCPRKK